MTRIIPVDPADVGGKAKELLDAVQATLGATPNMFRTMAVSPAVLEGYLGLSGALRTGELGGRLGEQIALAVAEANDCGYCLAAHNYLGKNLAGLSDDEVEQSRRGDATEPDALAALRFALTLVEKRGGVSDGDVEQVREAGFSDAAIAEIVAHVAVNILTNYFNRAAGVEIDFPAVESLAKAA